MPKGTAGAASVGGVGLPDAGTAGVAGVEPGAGAGPDEGGAPGVGGASGVGDAPGFGGALIGVGGSPDPLGGASGAAGTGACASPKSLVGDVTADTWIEAANPKKNHGSDKTLSVISGGQERRALLQLALPAVPAAAVLLRATLSLHLESNADGGLAPRRLAVHQLAHEVMEGRATWEKWSNGTDDWATAGGDFGPTLAEATLEEGLREGALTFDVTEPVAKGLAAKAASLPFIVLETDAPPQSPAELAFTAQGGNASGIPALIVEYCAP